MAETKAWLLVLGNGLQAAIGYHHIMEYVAIEKVEIKPLPLTFDFVPGVVVSNGQLHPVLDLAAFISPKQKLMEPESGLVMVQYQEASGQPLKIAGLVVRSAPKEILVSSGMACSLPQASGVWSFLAEACFNHDEAVVPVLQLEKAFGPKLGMVYAQRMKKMKAAQHSKEVESNQPKTQQRTKKISKPVE